jgi:hypothetical protein
MAQSKPIEYDEGQWFAIPLRKGGYAIGIIVRGSFKTKGGLGYFFGPKYLKLPTGNDTFEKNSFNPILIGQFGDLGIIRDDWPLINDGKPFVYDDWPVPFFQRVLPLPEGKIVIVEYGQRYSGNDLPIHERITDVSDELLKLPKDCIHGSGAVEIILTNMLM